MLHLLKQSDILASEVLKKLPLPCKPDSVLTAEAAMYDHLSYLTSEAPPLRNGATNTRGS